MPLRAAPPLLDRPRLRAAFPRGWKAGVLTAPAGFGKSTLARQLAGPGAMWIRLDAADRAPSHLLGSWLAAAARLPGAPLARTRRLFLARRDFERDGGLLTSSLVDELSRRREARVVFDDAQALSGAREAVNWLTRVIEESGPRARFLITARGENPVPLARVALTAPVVTCDTSRLAFTAEESERYLRLARPDLRDRARREALARAAAGWAVGLALIARAPLARHPDVPARADVAECADESREALFEWMAEQILAPLPGPLGRRLAAAATLERIEFDLLEAMLGRNEAQALLRDIARLDLLATPEAPGEALRFHPLFRDFLRRRFDAATPAGARARWYRRLARILAARHRGADSIAAEIAGGDLKAARRRFDRAARAPGEDGAALGRVALELQRRAPDPAAWSPWIRLALASETRDAGDLAGAIAHARAAEDGFAEMGLDEAVARAFVIEAHAASLAARHRESALRGETLRRRVAGSRLSSALVSAHTGSLWLGAGNPRRASTRLLEAVEGLRGGRHELERADIELRLAAVDFTRGRWRDYLTRAEGALARFRRAGHATRAQTLAINMAEACIYLGEEARAEELFDDAHRLAARSSAPANAAFIAIGRARAASERGDHRAAADRFRAARARIEPMGLNFALRMLDVWEGVNERRRGRLGPAARRLGRAADGFASLQAPAWHALARMEAGLVEGLRGDAGAAIAVLAEVARYSKRSGDLKELARNRLFEARVRQAAGRPFESALRSALALLARERYPALLRKESDVVTPLRAASVDPATARAFAGLGLAAPSPARAAPARIRRASGRAASPALHVKLLGGLRVTRGGREVRFARRAAAALVAMLALGRGRKLRREEIAERLWPDAPRAASRNRFDVTLNAARRAIEPEAGARGPFRWLRSEPGSCWLETEGLDLDLEAFDDAVRDAEPWLAQRAARPWETAASVSPRAAAVPGRLDRVIAISAGELLPEFADAGWCAEPRIQRRERHRRLLLAAGAESLAARRFERAAEHAARLRQSDPLDEEALRIELVALARDGRAAIAARHYREFTRRLEREIGAEPAPETALLAAELGLA